MDDLLSTLLNSVNETLTTAIVVLTASMLLYNLSRNLRNRVARTSGIVLLCVTIVSMCDVLISLGPSQTTLENIVRAQWIGIAFIPAATFHLSDALLATTGLTSRGRRRRVTRLLYFIGALFVIAAAFTDDLIKPAIRGTELVNITGGPLFIVYIAFFVSAVVTAFINVQRARQRCLTRDTRRRMGYLQFAMLTPVFGIFPYSVLLGISETGSIGMLVLVNIANAVLIMMLLFLSYPLSFFGSAQPDRVVKTDLLRFMLRGPATGLLALAVILVITPATRVLGLPSTSFVQFAVVTVVLLWQWFVALVLPMIEKRLIYSDEDDDQLEKLQTLSERLLTRSDLMQLLDAILSSTCDYLQVNTAFVISLASNTVETISAVGPLQPEPDWLTKEATALRDILAQQEANDQHTLRQWHSYWVAPLYSRRIIDDNGEQILIGILGLQARSVSVDLTKDEWGVLHKETKRAAETLDDLRLQSEIYAALEGLLPQITITRTRAADVEYRPGRNANKDTSIDTFDREQFNEQVKAALKHYWGGPGLTSSGLQELKIVRNALHENGDNPTRALRSVIQKAIEHQRPVGERKFLSPEWLVYNILDERFIERHKVRDAANKLALSEPDFYRKQNVAIMAVADTLLEMELNGDNPDSTP
ncbi:MAG: hypothetical protein GC179_15155 [Anaerolineaceae bacterium]|nr:hypothetical protein [Anaerolineaceae bacterium]